MKGISQLAKAVAETFQNKRLGKPCVACQTTAIMCPRCGEMAPLVKLLNIEGGKHVFRCDCDGREFSELCPKRLRQ